MRLPNLAALIVVIATMLAAPATPAAQAGVPDWPARTGCASWTGHLVAGSRCTLLLPTGWTVTGKLMARSTRAGSRWHLITSRKGSMSTLLDCGLDFPVMAWKNTLTGAFAFGSSKAQLGLNDMLRRADVCLAQFVLRFPAPRAGERTKIVYRFSLKTR